MLGLSLQANLKTEVREFLKLAVPLASAQLAQSATGFVDTIMMGRMGPDALAAGGLASIILLSVMLGATGMVMGISPLVAEAFGAGQKTRIQHLVRQGLWLSIMVALPMMIVMSQSNHWLLWVGQAEATVQLADTYLNIILWGLFPVVGFAALRATVSALSHARPVMTIMVTGTAFNIAGNYVLGFGKLGFPQMGLAGLALASVIAHHRYGAVRPEASQPESISNFSRTPSPASPHSLAANLGRRAYRHLLRTRSGFFYGHHVLGWHFWDDRSGCPPDRLANTDNCVYGATGYFFRYNGAGWAVVGPQRSSGRSAGCLGQHWFEYSFCWQHISHVPLVS